MNKKILTIAIIAVTLAMTTPTFALTLNTSIPSTPLSNIPTSANSIAGTSVPPTVIAKAEWIQTKNEIDYDPAKPWLQVDPPTGFNTSKTLGYLIVAEGNSGIGSLPGKNDLPAAFADVYNPNGCIKYEVAMPHVISCDDSTPTEISTWLDYLNNKYNKGLITFANGWTISEVTNALLECSAKLYYGFADIDTCQMCGQFTWESHCEGTTPCQTVWTPIDNSTGYKVDAYVFGKDGTKSNILENHFEYLCSAGIETDFNSLNYENVTYNQHKWIEGDYIWNDPKGPACKLTGGCVAPSIRNIGNIPVNLTVWQDDMGFGRLSNGAWNVEWDARLGEITQNAPVSYNPFVTTTIPGGLDICELNKISFSILPKKAQDLGSRNGTITLTPVPVTFPWFSNNCGGCNYSVVPTNVSHPGLYGSTVTPVTITNTDCSQVTALRIDSTQQFGPSGWAGWSCVEVGYPNAVGGGVVGGIAAAQGLAEFGAPAVGGFNYPVYPHYTFNGGSNAPGGEEGWVVQAGSPVPTGIYVLCAQ